MLTQVKELAHYRQYQQDRTDRVIAGIVLGQVLCGCLTNPDFVVLVVDDVISKWRQYLDRLEVLTEVAGAEGEAGARNVELMADEIARRLSTPPARATALHKFVDDYVLEIEGEQDLPADTQARIWFAHAKRLAPPDHPIHTSAAARLGHDPGV